MTEGPNFPPSADEPQDPLLRALRERLGEGFGQAPPPQLWAAIAPQLPVPPRPWWRRRSRLLPLLALLGTLVLVGTLAVRQAGLRRGPQAVTAPPAQPRGLAAQLAPNPAGVSRVGRPAPSAPTGGLTGEASDDPLTAPASAAARPSQPAATNPPLVATALPTAPVAPAAGVAAAPTAAEAPAPATGQPAAVSVAPHRPATAALAASAARRAQLAGTVFQQLQHSAGISRRAKQLATARRYRRAATATKYSTARAATRPRPASTQLVAAPTPLAAKLANTKQRALAQSRPATARATALPARRLTTPATAPPAAFATKLPTERNDAPAAATPASAGAAGGAQRRPAGAATRPDGFATLALRRSALAAAALPLPAPLAARPDSTTAFNLPPVRRWSVQVLAGPTLSYRTLGTATAASATVPVSFSQLGSSGSPATIVSLERPALGFGAQVQARRVLSGRWALAFGAGYQEYATRLVLQLTHSGSSSNTSTQRADSALATNQRDTYRLLTLPVQLSYALGAPRGRLSLGLLAGLEPGLYLGGRTTEGSSCNCQQQSFSSATGSPYNQFNLGLSLGLDVRYRLGGPASRWQWVLQPTGRYVATPFVRSTALGYAPRQPYSLGLLTGLAWAW